MYQTATERSAASIPLDKRLHRSRYFKEHELYKDSVPVYIQFKKTDKPYKYIVPGDVPFGSLMVAFRRKNVIRPSEALMAMVEYAAVDDDGTPCIRGMQVIASTTIRRLADDYLNEDGFLYVTVATENVFG